MWLNFCVWCTRTLNSVTLESRFSDTEFSLGPFNLPLSHGELVFYPCPCTAALHRLYEIHCESLSVCTGVEQRQTVLGHGRAAGMWSCVKVPSVNLQKERNLNLAHTTTTHSLPVTHTHTQRLILWGKWISVCLKKSLVPTRSRLVWLWLPTDITQLFVFIKQKIKKMLRTKNLYNIQRDSINLETATDRQKKIPNFICQINVFWI